MRTRIYFTSESHIHSLVNVLRWAHIRGGPSAAPLLSPEACRLLDSILELDYLTHVVFRWGGRLYGCVACWLCFIGRKVAACWKKGGFMWMAYLTHNVQVGGWGWGVLCVVRPVASPAACAAPRCTPPCLPLQQVRSSYLGSSMC